MKAKVLTELPPLPPPLRDFDTSMSPYSPNDPFPLVDDVFADDSAFFVSADTPHDAVRKLAVVVRLVNHTYRKHGLVVNFKAGKTEAMLYLRGPGTVRVKTRLFGELKSLLPICQPLFEQDPQVSYEGLRIVAVYKHIGP